MPSENIFESRKKYHPKEIPNLVTIPIVVWYKIAGVDAGEIGIYSFDYSGDKDTIILSRKEICVTLNIKEDIQKIAIDSLKEAIKDVRAKAFKEEMKIQEHIDKLTQITYQPDKELNEDQQRERYDAAEGEGAWDRDKGRLDKIVEG